MEAFRGGVGEEKVSVFSYLILQLLLMSTRKALPSAVLHYRSQILVSGYC